MNGFWNFQEYAFEMGKVQDNLLFKDHSFFYDVTYRISDISIVQSEPPYCLYES